MSSRLQQLKKKVFDIYTLFGECRAVDYLTDKVRQHEITQKECRYLLTAIVMEWRQYG